MQYWNLRKKRGLLVALLLLAVLGKAPLSGAQGDPTQPNPNYEGAAVLLVIDQSGSMGGKQLFPGLLNDATDPNNIRFHGAQAVAQFLGDYRANVASDMPAKLAVLNFGDLPNLALDWTELAPPQPNQSWDQQKQMILDLLSPEHFGVRNLGWTNFETAFERAKQMFDQAAFPSNWLKAVIVLTDGQPCAHKDCTDGEGHAMLNRVQSFVQKSFAPPDFQVYVVGIEEPSSPWVTEFRQDWLNIVGNADHFKPVNSMDEVSAFFYDIIFRDLLNNLNAPFKPGAVNLVNGRGQKFIPPYLRKVDILVFKDQPTPTEVLQINSPDGTTISRNDPQITVTDVGNGLIETWSIKTPPPGMWDFRVDQTVGAQVSLRTGEYEPQVFTNVLELRPLQWADTSLQIEVFIDQANQTYMVALPDYPVELSADILRVDDGAVVAKGMQFAQISNGVYQSTFAALEPGSYTVFPNVWVVDKKGASGQAGATVLHLLQSKANNPGMATFTFRVFEARAEMMPLPTTNWLQRKDHHPISVQVRDAQTGDPAPPLSHLNVTANIVDAGGAVVQTVALPPDSTQSHIFTESVAIEDPGTYTVEATGTLSLPDGSKQDLFTLTQASPIAVRPLKWVEVKIVHPADGDTLYMLDPLAQARPMKLSIQVVDDAGQLVDLETAAGSSTPLHIALTQPDGSVDTPAPLLISPGQYELTLDYGLDSRGEFTLQANGDGPLGGDYAYAEDDASTVVGDSDQVRFGWDINPAFWVAWGIIIAGVLGVSVVTGAVVRWYQNITENPIIGCIILYEAPVGDTSFGPPIWREDLTSPKRNHKVVKVPKSVCKARVILDVSTGGSEAFSKSSRVYLKATFENRTSAPKLISPESEPVEIGQNPENGNICRVAIRKTCEDVYYDPFGG